MIRPRRMKRVEITVLERDLNTVLALLGRRGVMQFSLAGSASRDKTVSERDSAAAKHALALLESLKNSAAFLGVELPAEPAEDSVPLAEFFTSSGEGAKLTADSLIAQIRDEVTALEQRELNANLEKERIAEARTALKGFAHLDSPIEKLKDLSFLNLKIGRLEHGDLQVVQNALGDRGVVIPLDDEGKEVLAASSRLGRFALDSALRKQDFAESALPSTDAASSPADKLQALEQDAAHIDAELASAAAEKKRLSGIWATQLQALYASALMTREMEEIRGRLVATQNAYMLSGWIEADAAAGFTSALEEATDGRIALLSYDPHEREEVQNGTEKVPVSLKHGRFAASFQPLVLSYGAPRYSSIDPTAITAVFFTLLFAVMFGDMGQGLVLFLLGVLAGKKSVKALAGYRHFAGPLKSVGLASMTAGFFYGAVFSNETLLEGPTEALTGFLARTGVGKALGIHETTRFISLMPDAASITKLFYFFAFTLGIGVVINSIGLIINIINQFSFHRYAKAILSRTGLAGLAFFWYALSIGIRALLDVGGGCAGVNGEAGGFQFGGFDVAGLCVPLFVIVTGPFWARVVSGRRPLFEEGFLSFVIEGVVEILETLSGYVSNTVSFLRVGAFALSHAVLSFIIFTMAEKVGEVSLGPLWSFIVILFGNLVIIVLEGMIVAIQVTRLQYYEFFSKFFTETGSEFSPFRFRKRGE